MKNVLLATVALYSMSGFALTKVITPSMLLENGFEFESVKVTNICQQADGSFKTITPASNKCVTYRRNFRSRHAYLNSSNGCLITGKLHLFGPEYKTKGECTAWGRQDGDNGCTNISYSEVKAPTTYTIKKVSMKRVQGNEGGAQYEVDQVLSSWTHTIPACN